MLSRELTMPGKAKRDIERLPPTQYALELNIKRLNCLAMASNRPCNNESRK